MKSILLVVLAGSSIPAIVAATPASAQNSQPPQTLAQATAQSPATGGAKDKDEEIIITGTQIRGIAPVGSNVVGISSDQIKTSGVTDANQLLGQLPQSNFFNQLPEPGGGVIGAGTARVPISRPNLRNLPVGGAGSGALTLVLLNGNRLVPSGIEQSAVDAGVVPTSLLERFEAILDGASAVYGSDAVGGVINYITRKKYDGAEVSARYGFADDYWQTQISATVGKTWSTGGFSLNYEFSKNSNLLLGDRGYNSPINWINPLDPVTGVATAVGTTNATSGILSVPHVSGLGCDIPNVQDAGASGASTATKTHHVQGTYTGDGTGFAVNPLFCATNAFTTQTPSQRKHSVFAVFSQDITDHIKFDVTGLYSNRLQTQNSGPVRGNVVIRNNNPNYRCDSALVGSVPCADPLHTGEPPMRVQFSYGPALGNDQGFNDTRVKTWQITPTVTADLGKNWQVRASGTYGESKTSVTQNATDSTRLAEAVSGTALAAGPFLPMALADSLNPYDIAATPAAVLNKIFYHNYTEGVHKMTDFRVIADGPLLTLPGGDVRVAVGAEYNKTTLRTHKLDTTGGTTHGFLPPVKAGVTTKSVFGELVVPVFGPDNAVPGFHSLTLSASGRYDRYGGGLDTFNPKLALTFEPFSWITFRANWGKSFRAPNPADKVGSANATIRCIGGNGTLAGCGNAVMQVPYFLDVAAGTVLDTDENIAGIQTAPCFATTNTACAPPTPSNRQGNALASNAVFIGLFGTDPNLVPETSKSWSVGADLRPPFVPGLTLSATYWNIAFKNIISLPQPAITLDSLFRFLPQNYTICRVSTNTGTFPYAGNLCTDPGGVYHQALVDFAAQANGGSTVLNTAIANGNDIVYFVSTQTTNLATAKLSGIDASVRYRTDTGFGSIDGSISGAWLLKSNLQFAANAPFVDQLASGQSIFRMSAQLGATIGDFRAQATWRHQDGYLDTFNLGLGGTQRDPSQKKIHGTNVIDLAFQYDINGSSVLTKDLQLQLVINNVFDAAPDVSKTATGGALNNLNTVGRLFEFGISKRF